ncbi:hypothetical protein [Burkholderia multivorans]|uniref:hypothetical protein n=1 Tax=Burkholderia multivorans TaxID=87883 RepID=UPI001C24F947|nr:hypothetical protein [Burkholderia multivorans]MBU9413500.1 hypothetical protein [Burkholderia multivorans]
MSIFVNDANVTEDEFDAAFVNAISKTSVVVDVVHIVGYTQEVDRVRAWVTAQNSVLHGRFTSLVGVADTGMRCIRFDQESGEYVIETVYGNPIPMGDLIRRERQEVLLEAFKLGGGEQRAPAGTHYVKTSASHADRFLRVSNVLEDGANVSLIAYWLAGYLWKRPIRYVIVDTSGIYSVAQKVIHEVGSRGGLIFQPSLCSHRSYDGIDQIAEHQAAVALFVISASSSGGLARRLIQRGAAPDALVTLFLLAPSTSAQGHILCNLIGSNGNGLAPIINYAADECPYCREHFHRIQIQGDQFSITPPNVSSVEIIGSDLPDTIKSALSPLLGLRVFCCYRRRENDRIATIGANVAPLLHAVPTQKNQAFLGKKRAEWASLVRRSSTVSLRHVVSCTYPYSKELAEEIAKSTRNLLQKLEHPTAISSGELRSATPEQETSTLVISSCIDEGKELLSVSRTLRDIQENGSTTYLSALQLINPKSEVERLRSNLTYGQHGPNSFSMHCLISLPIDCYEEAPSWSTELEELRRIVSYADQHDLEVPIKLEERIAHLTQAPGTGLIDDLFWPTPEGRPLALRSDFALITDARNAPEATQADLFIVIAIILTQLRMNKDASRRLSHNAYERSIFAPENFDRFNDGVLQASMLRAARPQELSYGACDVSVSERMLNVLMHALPGQPIKERSEALMEFLIALAINRLTLHSNHLREFCEKIIATASAEDSAQLTARYLLQREQKRHPQKIAPSAAPRAAASSSDVHGPEKPQQPLQLEIEIQPGQNDS